MGNKEGREEDRRGESRRLKREDETTNTEGGDEKERGKREEKAVHNDGEKREREK